MHRGDMRCPSAERSERAGGYPRRDDVLPGSDATPLPGSVVTLLPGSDATPLPGSATATRAGRARADLADELAPCHDTCPARQTGLMDGSLVLTAGGLRPIEALRRGELVATLLPRGPFFVPIAWIGYRPASVKPAPTRPDWPVLIRRHAIARDMPATDMLLAPEHAIYVGESLYLPRMLINGRSIAYQRPASAAPRYWGFGLDVPNVVLAQNLAVESLMPAATLAYVETSPPARRASGRPALRLVKA